MKRVRLSQLLFVSSVFLMGMMNSCIVANSVPSTTHTHTTYVPSTTYVPTTQVVTQVSTRPVAQQNVTVSAVSEDISYNLDLQAVGNIFGVSSSLEDFERRINSYDTQISNLDLNRDGYVDYLRVVEVQEGFTHLVVLQAVLATNVYQDVATIEVERYGSSHTVTIVGDPYIYGTSYVLRPTYVHVPVIYNVFYGPSYRVWRSPYYWGYFPSYYRHRHCVHVNVYHQHIVVHNKNYHHSYHYIDDYRPRYEGIRNTVSRNDYATAHPEESFSRRNSEVRNARGIQTENTRRTAVKASDAVRKEASSSSSRRVTSSTTSKVTTTTSSSSSRRTSTTTTPATSTTSKSDATTSSSSRRTSTTSSTTSTPKVSTTTSSSSSRRTSTTTTPATSTTSKSDATTSSTSRRTTTTSSTTSTPKVSTTTSSSSSRRTSTTTTPATSTTSKSDATTSSSSRRTTTTSSTTSTPKVSTTTSSSSSRRTSTTSAPRKASSTIKAASSSSSKPSVNVSSSTRRSSATSTRSSGTSTRSTSSTSSTRSSGSRR